MSNIEFTWDGRKAKSNLAKHGVSFEEAKTAFLDENGRLLDDPDHSENEDRFVLLAYSFNARCLIESRVRQSCSAVEKTAGSAALPAEQRISSDIY